jgi:hypothetical protein
MLGAVTEHLGQPELWRRYLALLLDGMRARPDLTPLPDRRMPRGKFGAALINGSERDAHRRATEN